MDHNQYSRPTTGAAIEGNPIPPAITGEITPSRQWQAGESPDPPSASQTGLAEQKAICRKRRQPAAHSTSRTPVRQAAQE
jgi:hypothetical protein